MWSSVQISCRKMSFLLLVLFTPSVIQGLEKIECFRSASSIEVSMACLQDQLISIVQAHEATTNSNQCSDVMASRDQHCYYRDITSEMRTLCNAFTTRSWTVQEPSLSQCSSTAGAYIYFKYNCISIKSANSLPIRTIRPMSEVSQNDQVSQIFLQTTSYPGAINDFTNTTCLIKLPPNTQLSLNILDLLSGPSKLSASYCLEIQDSAGSSICAGPNTHRKLTYTPGTEGDDFYIKLRSDGINDGLKTRFWILLSGIQLASKDPAKMFILCGPDNQLTTERITRWRQETPILIPVQKPNNIIFSQNSTTVGVIIIGPIIGGAISGVIILISGIGALICYCKRKQLSGHPQAGHIIIQPVKTGSTSSILERPQAGTQGLQESTYEQMQDGYLYPVPLEQNLGDAPEPDGLVASGYQSTQRRNQEENHTYTTVGPQYVEILPSHQYSNRNVPQMQTDGNYTYITH